MELVLYTVPDCGQSTFSWAFGGGNKLRQFVDAILRKLRYVHHVSNILSKVHNEDRFVQKLVSICSKRKENKIVTILNFELMEAFSKER